MSDTILYAALAGAAAGVFYYMFKKASGGDYKPIELKNCPLCGQKTAKFVTMGTFKHDTLNKVVCTNCGATTDDFTSYKKAAEAWNKGEVKIYAGVFIFLMLFVYKYSKIVSEVGFMEVIL